MTEPCPLDDRFREVFNLVEPHIENRYGIPVIIKDVPYPFTGDLDGAEIHVDHFEDIENALFIMAHLFGHTVQWNVSAEAREVGLKQFKNPTDDELAVLRAYELTACRYSLQLFHDLGIHDLDQWMSDFAACDYTYLVHFYRTGERRPFRSFWTDGQPVLMPLAIPSFTPSRWISRWDGVVV
jgi:hypothetical protein